MIRYSTIAPLVSKAALTADHVLESLGSSIRYQSVFFRWRLDGYDLSPRIRSRRRFGSLLNCASASATGEQQASLVSESRRMAVVIAITDQASVQNAAQGCRIGSSSRIRDGEGVPAGPAGLSDQSIRLSLTGLPAHAVTAERVWPLAEIRSRHAARGSQADQLLCAHRPHRPIDVTGSETQGDEDASLGDFRYTIRKSAAGRLAGGTCIQTALGRTTS